MSQSDLPPGAARTYRQVRFERPPGSTEILLVRHGESAIADPERPFLLVEGRGDPELSPEGREQAERLGERLGRLEIAACYVTPLRRTEETAAPLLSRLGIKAKVEPGMVEINMGEWEGGLYRKKIAEKDPLAAEVFRQERWDLIPGGEGNQALFERTGSAIRRIAERHADELVVVVAHAVSISAVLSQSTGASPFAFVGGDNASISTIVVSSERWSLRRFNDTAHLE
ncbi:MAG: histidine phosphatase family protein [Acidimicrobiaceae bacterium]|nr:histidine phosphatase family protein [Acidimicrobiaceae bacterium]